MPYIKQEDRKRLEEDGANAIKNAGELNYAFTRIAMIYFENNGGRYQQINDIVGALEGAKLEFARRVVADYEDGAIARNGDVY